MILYKYLLLFILLITPIARAKGVVNDSIQLRDSIFRTVSMTYDLGLVIPHHNDIIYYMEDFVHATEITYGVVNYKKNNWSKYYYYPETGIGFLYSTMGNKQVFGSGFILYPYIQSTIFRTKHFYIRNKVSLGLGYITKPFDVHDNPYNSIYSSRFNIYVGFGLYSSYKISNNWQLKGKISLNHLSNGLNKVPNNGINTFSIGMGVGYCFNKNDEPLNKKIKAPQNNSRDVLIVGSFGKSQISYYDSKIYYSASLNINNIWYHSEKTAWGVGADIMYSGAASYLYTSNPNEEHLASEKIYGGLFGSYNLIMGKTELFMQIGVYVLYHIKPIQPVYPRIGIRQKIFRNLYANFSLKANFFSAEFLEFGLGYRINFKKNGF